MKFLLFFTKYSTRILLVLFLAFTIAISVSSYNKSYNKKAKSIKHIASVSDTKIKITSFPETSGGLTDFKGVITESKHKNLVGTNTNVILKTDTELNLFPGDTIIVSGDRFEPAQKRNIGGFDGVEYAKSENIHGTIYSKTEALIHARGENRFLKEMCTLRNKFSAKADEVLKPQYAALAKALITGDRSSVTLDASDAFKTSGVYHIVAISGMHLNIFIMLFTYAISSLKLKRLKKALLMSAVCVTVGGFVLVFTGYGLSVIRAFAMLVISLGSSIFARRYDSKNALLIATAAITIFIPSSFFSVGFQLSVLSTLGVLLSLDVISKLKASIKFARIGSKGVTLTFVTSVLCSLITLPVTADAFGFLPVYSFVANMLILPLMAPALGGCMAFGIVSVSGLDFAARIISYPLSGILHLIITFAKTVASLPMSSMSLYPKYTAYIAAISLGVAVCTYLLFKCRRIAAIITAVFFSVAVSGIFVYNKANTDARVIFAYADQGDCAIITLPGGEAAMVDFGTGSGSGYILEEIELSLVKYNISKLDAVFVSHFHTDHVSGITKLTEKGKIKNIFIPKYYDISDKETTENRQCLLRAALRSDTPVCYVSDGSSVTLKGGGRFDVLSPSPAMFGDANNLSSVIKFTYGKVSFLFTGDIEEDGIKNLYNKDTQCDVMKIPHHGSKNSNDAYFIAKSKPSYALISCGENNAYDHPDKVILDTLKENDVKVYRTDRDGAVTFYFNKKEIKSIETMR